MTFQEIIDNAKPEIEQAVANFKSEILKLRTNRLSPALVEDIEAECFGSALPLKQLGAISSVGPRELSLQLWDRSYVEGVVKALEQEGLGLSVRIDDNTVYLTSPALTEDSRKNLILVLNKKKEETFQILRHLRDKAWKKLQDKCQTGEVREDDKFRGRDKLDDLVREVREKIENLSQNKEKEIKG